MRILQCYKCLRFGHFAKDCIATSICGHSVPVLVSRETAIISIKCLNVIIVLVMLTSVFGAEHSALDARRCPILRNKIKDKLLYINYE